MDSFGLERIFADQLDFAFSDAWGYLTACPTNTGTGLRASVMIHFIDSVSVRTLNELMVETQPAHLQYRTKQCLDANARDVLRAEWVRHRLISS
jgi:protein-arginine kinase